jgi:hydrogenase expression/formation protein HypE
MADKRPHPVAPSGLLKSDVSPPERGGHAQDEDAKSANSSAIGATEDEVPCRSVRSGGRVSPGGEDFAFQQPSSPYLRDGRPFRVVSVVFDFDGTLTAPGEIDFAAIHEAIGCPRGVGLLEFLDSMADPEERRRKEELLIAAETEAAGRCRANAGAQELVALLRQHSIPMAIITRNRREAVEVAFARLDGMKPEDFALVVTRDLPLSPKPFPDGLQFIARELGLDMGTMLVVGDHAFDIEAGQRAGALTMFLSNDPREAHSSPDADFVVDTLAEAGQLIRYGLPLPAGKLPPDFLEEGLTGITVADPAVLIGAGIGEDAAAVDVREAEVLVLASDPITLAADSMARYVVLANANDVATSGATPRWLLSTLLFPYGTSASEILALVRDIQAVCAGCGIALCGGHTEITDAVSRPLAVGTVAGTAALAELLDKRQMREGDLVLLTKGVAVEGTGLLAQEYGDRLAKAGITAAEIADAARFLDRIGILEEARVACSFSGVSALHDVTEGGLATAVRELGAAGGRRLRLHVDKIPVYQQTRRVCEALGLDPFGLIGSGSLLMACSPTDVGALVAAIGAAGIEIAEIGEVLGSGEGIEALKEGASVEWPVFARDEVTRLGR